MIDLILKSTLVLLLSAAAAFVLRGQSAGLVHRVWMAGLVGALAVPVVNFLVPHWSPGFVPSLDFEQALGPVTAELQSSLADLPFVVWIAGAAIGLGIMLCGTLRLAWLVVGAERLLDSRWAAIASDIRRQLDLNRPVQLLHSSRVRFFGTWGIWRPRILVPTAARGWEDERVRIVLAHELAHVARGDWPVQVLAEAARAIYWFNPLFWMLASKLRQESEHASDNVVLGLGIGRAEYARELLEVSRFLGEPPRSGGPILAITQPSFLETRLVAVLNPKLKRVAAAPWATVIIMLLAVAVTVPLATLRDSTAVGARIAAPGGSSPFDRAACPVTPTIAETPPNPQMTASFGTGPWHVNGDRSIWVWDQPYVSGQQVHAIWIRPQGSELVVNGERLDGDAPALEAKFQCCYSLAFKTGGLRFPTPGCWRVTATAGDRSLTFVTYVGESTFIESTR